jgi:hypothetical protein
MDPRRLAKVRTQRGLVDYALRRRSLLQSVTAGRVSVAEVCEATSYLLQAAKFHGVSSDVVCPVCRKENVTYVYWVYGAELGASANSARTPDELERLADLLEEFTVHQVEVCRTCSWNHLVASFVMGRGNGESSSARRSGT